MRPDSKQCVLDAIAAGRIPCSGPSEITTRGLLDQVPAGYWDWWSAAAVQRIREQEKRGFILDRSAS